VSLIAPNWKYLSLTILHSISKITEDPAKLTTLLTARTAPWSDVAGTYDLDFGQAMPYQKPPQLKQRGLWGDIMNVGKDVLNAAEGNADLSKSVTFDVSVGHQGQRTNIYTDDKGRLTLDCINCFVAGRFEVTGHLSVDHFNLQDLQLTASPNNFQAELELEATITSSDNPDSLQYTKELFSFPIPDAGIEVEGIFKLGATLSYDVGVSSSFSGSATVDFGIQAGIPNSAQLIVDVQNPDQSSANGFGTSDLTPIFDIKKESASVTLAAFSQPKLAFGVELSEVGNIDVAITIKIPEISVTLSAEYDEAGACSQTPGSSQTGVKLDSEVDVEVDLQIDASLGDDEDTAKPSWSKKLWGASQPLGSMCFPLEIPGLERTVNATSKTALPSTSSSGIASDVTSASYSFSQSSNLASVTGSYPAPTSISSSVSLSDLASIPFITSASVTSGSGSSSTVTDLLSTLASSPSKSIPSSSGPASITLAPTSSSSLGSSSAALATSSSISQDAVGGKKAVVVHSKSTSTSHVSSKSLPSTTTSKLTSSTKASAAETVDVPPKPKHTTSAPEVEEAPILTTEKPSPTSSSKMSSAVTEITSSAESGGGGCRMVKRFGKRMLVC